MPSEGLDDRTRVVIDETSFDFRGLSDGLIEEHLDSFNDAVQELRRDGIIPCQPPAFGEFPCTDEIDIDNYLWGPSGEEIDPETRRRFFSLLQKCPEWDSWVASDPDVAIGADDPCTAYSVAFALASSRLGWGVACLVFGGCGRRGFIKAAGGAQLADIFFFAAPRTLPEFWRSLYVLEKVKEADFLPLARLAFPALVFCPDLSFRRFTGTYEALLPDVVLHLSLLNDHFLRFFREFKGIPSDIEVAMRNEGLPAVSPESPKTHASKRLMKQREVPHGGGTVLCEWHTKIRDDVNRIHFAPQPSERDGEGTIFIGIFVDHLPL